MQLQPSALVAYRELLGMPDENDYLDSRAILARQRLRLLSRIAYLSPRSSRCRALRTPGVVACSRVKPQGVED
jgi:hypothetical protein